MSKPSPATGQPVSNRVKPPLQTVFTGKAARPQCLIFWDPLAESEIDPNSRYREMKVGGDMLHEFLYKRINKAILRWQKLANKPESVAEAIRIKDSCLSAIDMAHKEVLQPGIDRSSIIHAITLCVNAIRTVTVLCNHVIDWPDSDGAAPGPGTSAATPPVEFGLSRYFAGMRSYHSTHLTVGMLPFGSGSKLTPIRREIPDDPRLLANLFASSPKAVTEGHDRILVKLREPLSNAYDNDEDNDGIIWKSSAGIRAG